MVTQYDAVAIVRSDTYAEPSGDFKEMPKNFGYAPETDEFKFMQQLFTDAKTVSHTQTREGFGCSANVVKLKQPMSFDAEFLDKFEAFAKENNYSVWIGSSLHRGAYISMGNLNTQEDHAIDNLAHHLCDDRIMQNELESRTPILDDYDSGFESDFGFDI